MFSRLVNQLFRIPNPKYPCGTKVRIIQCHQQGKLIDISPVEGIIKSACPLMVEYGGWGYSIDCGDYYLEALEGGIQHV